MQNTTGNTHFGSGDTTNRATPAAALTTNQVLPVGAYSSSAAPTSSGCISDISSDSIHGCEHDYAAAMKNYGVIYEEYQSYLMPTNQLIAHDYNLGAQPVPAFSHLGCLNQDLLESTVLTDDVSDDEIENCGYLGWLHH
ncbi:MAG: hypothetical protein JWM78_2723 [Verrucomicrobiaceae bacterium]|nr:hypothetical protein [Verrucomicrobiaceae bacterium]